MRALEEGLEFGSEWLVLIQALRLPSSAGNGMEVVACEIQDSVGRDLKGAQWKDQVAQSEEE